MTQWESSPAVATSNPRSSLNAGVASNHTSAILCGIWWLSWKALCQWAVVPCASLTQSVSQPFKKIFNSNKNHKAIKRG